MRKNVHIMRIKVIGVIIVIERKRLVLSGNSNSRRKIIFSSIIKLFH